MRILEWYRLDRSATLWRVLAAGASSMTVGALVIGLSFLARQPFAVRVAAAVFGFLAIACGPLLVFFGLRGTLSEDRYLALLPEGVLLHFDEQERTLSWDDLERVDAEPRGNALHFRLRNGEVVVVAARFAGLSNRELAVRLDAARRKAAFHLLG